LTRDLKVTKTFLDCDCIQLSESHNAGFVKKVAVFATPFPAVVAAFTPSWACLATKKRPFAVCRMKAIPFTPEELRNFNVRKVCLDRLRRREVVWKTRRRKSDSTMKMGSKHQKEKNHAASSTQNK